MKRRAFLGSLAALVAAPFVARESVALETVDVVESTWPMPFGAPRAGVYEFHVEIAWETAPTMPIDEQMAVLDSMARASIEHAMPAAALTPPRLEAGRSRWHFRALGRGVLTRPCARRPWWSYRWKRW